MEESSSLRNFNQIYTEYQARFIRFANTYVRDVSIAEDITSEAFMAYWENRLNLDSQSNIPAYILTIIKNKCLNHLQHQITKDRVLNDIKDAALWEMGVRISSLEACNPQTLFSNEVQKIVDQTLSSMPKRTLEIFMMSRYRNKSHKEIGEALNITTKGVEFHITKALSLLRKNLKDYMFFIISLFYYKFL